MENKPSRTNKPSQILVYLCYCLISATLYGLVAFFLVYQGLAGGAMLQAYLWNIAFIIIFLLLDKLANDILLSKEMIITKKNYFLAGLVHTVSYISFKTTLYLFYAFILIASRMSLLEPNLFNDVFRGFVLSIEYCLILLVAFDKFIEHLLKDDKRIKRIAAKFARFTGLMARRKIKKEQKKGEIK